MTFRLKDNMCVDPDFTQPFNPELSLIMVKLDFGGSYDIRNMVRGQT